MLKYDSIKKQHDQASISHSKNTKEQSEKIKDIEKEKNCFKKYFDDKVKEIESLRAENTSMNEKHSTLLKDIAQNKTKFDEQSNNFKKAEDKINSLEKEMDKIQKDRKTIEQKYSEGVFKLDSLRKNHDELKNSYLQKEFDLKQKLEEAIKDKESLGMSLANKSCD